MEESKLYFPNESPSGEFFCGQESTFFSLMQWFSTLFGWQHIFFNFNFGDRLKSQNILKFM
jgi:hypothetical protein